MQIENYYKDVKHVIHISTSTNNNCKLCNTKMGADSFIDCINHYIKEHGYKILHVGPETSRDTEGHIWNSSVAILGK